MALHHYPNDPPRRALPPAATHLGESWLARPCQTTSNTIETCPALAQAPSYVHSTARCPGRLKAAIKVPDARGIDAEGGTAAWTQLNPQGDAGVLGSIPIKGVVMSLSTTHFYVAGRCGSSLGLLFPHDPVKLSLVEVHKVYNLKHF